MPPFGGYGAAVRVAIDARNLQGRPLDGIGRALAETLPLLGPDVDLTLLYDRRRGEVRTQVARGVALRSRLPTGTAWLQSPVAAWLRHFDGVFHCPFYALPFRHSGPMVVSLWDLTFELHPEWFPVRKRHAFRWQARHASRVARRIIVSSAAVHDEVRDRYEVDPVRIVTAPLASGRAFYPRLPSEVKAVRDRLRIAAPYVVAFGGTPRRRLGLAGDAWRRAGGPAVCALVVVGGRESLPGATRAGPLDDDCLAALVTGAAALLYPTAYEGFGLPAVEAQASGTPVVCARVGALPEVLGPHAAWVEDPTPAGFASQLTRVLDDPVYRNSLADGGLAWQRARPGWDATADAFHRAYREALSG